MTSNPLPFEGRWSYSCITTGPNGKLYAAPFGASNLLEIDPETSTVCQIGTDIVGDDKYECIGATATGMLYAPPWGRD
jgi:hypothetical protein